MTVELPSDHDNPSDSQLVVCLTGTPAYIEAQLKSLLFDMRSAAYLGHVHQYKRPAQGTRIHFNGKETIVTPSWEGEKF